MLTLSGWVARFYAYAPSGSEFWVNRGDADERLRTLVDGVQNCSVPERAFCCLSRVSPTEGEQAVRKANGLNKNRRFSRPADGAGFLPFPLLRDVPADVRPAYERAFVEAAREVGGLFLADGDVTRAWPYYRAVGESAPVAAAIEQIAPGEDIESVIAIAFQERVNPRKGFELILA